LDWFCFLLLESVQFLPLRTLDTSQKAIYTEETMGNLNDAITIYKEIDLTPKEFGLLALFVRRAGCALTRDEVLKRVWGYDLLVTARSVDRCVNTLCNKIEKNIEKYLQAPLFAKTIRDVGYRFES
jgi:two-component system, OmpR family, alkaline phosphatase synthesis response regulator PhoP